MPYLRALFDHRRTGQHFHAAADTRSAHAFERALRRDRQRLHADDVLRTSWQMHFAGRDHRRHAAIQVRFDPAHLVLARRPVAEDRMHVRIDQARRDRGAFAIDRGARAF